MNELAKQLIVNAGKVDRYQSKLLEAMKQKMEENNAESN